MSIKAATRKFYEVIYSIGFVKIKNILTGMNHRARVTVNKDVLSKKFDDLYSILYN